MLEILKMLEFSTLEWVQLIAAVATILAATARITNELISFYKRKD